jgi:hypothetical protein
VEVAAVVAAVEELHTQVAAVVAAVAETRENTNRRPIAH